MNIVVPRSDSRELAEAFRMALSLRHDEVIKRTYIFDLISTNELINAHQVFCWMFTLYKLLNSCQSSCVISFIY